MLHVRKLLALEPIANLVSVSILADDETEWFMLPSLPATRQIAADLHRLRHAQRASRKSTCDQSVSCLEYNPACLGAPDFAQTIEYGNDRYGSDVGDFSLPANSLPRNCYGACQAKLIFKAWPSLRSICTSGGIPNRFPIPRRFSAA